ncbi:MAG: polysaccharide pyruvyl transferase family protein [Candidatus Omnitrophota bacterium]
MKILILGWYGTETIGDRAILAGLLHFFKDSFGSFDCKLGSLYPFFTERTINEDFEFYRKSTDINPAIHLFDSKMTRELDSAIQASDLIVMGGGPLMHIDPIFMIEYAFKKAQHLKKKTALLGCGIGPFFSSKHKKALVSILRNSDLTILRDSLSQSNLNEILRQYGNEKDRRIFVSLDPSMRCVLDFNALHQPHEGDYVAINLRSFPKEYATENIKERIESSLYSIVDNLFDLFYGKKLILVPLSYFCIGGDDREILNRISLRLRKENLVVQNKPLALAETLEIFQNAFFNVGMRFHSIIFQTLSNGKNCILDYTEPHKGKISGFLKDIDPESFYASRYVSLQKDAPKDNFWKNVNIHDKFSYRKEVLEDQLRIYSDHLRKII